MMVINEIKASYDFFIKLYVQHVNAVTHSYLTLQSGKLVEIVKIHVWLLDTLEYAILK